MSVLEPTAVRLEASLARVQAHGRLPSVVAGVARAGELTWVGARGTAVRDGETARATADTQYRIGSITKTFTAALILQLRDRGLLDLSDRAGTYVPEGPLEDADLRGLLSHRAGVRAEPAGPWWERSEGMSYESLIAAHADLEPRVLAAGERYHYSNLAYAVLGRVVEKVHGAPWAEVVTDRLLGPAGMTRTTYGEQPPHAHGYSVEATTGLVTAEPHQDTRAMAPAGQMWSTVADLARWVQLLTEPDPAVLSAEAVTLMASPQSADPDENLTGAYGLGLRLSGPGPPILVGHGGSMPGFQAGVFLDRRSGVGAVVLANGGYGLDVEAVPRSLIETVLECEPPVPPEWVPTAHVHPAIRELLGTWHWGNAPYEITYDNDGGLLLTPRNGSKAGRFVPTGPDTWVGRSGYYTGETMRAVRDAAGVISHLDIATFCFTRVPYDPAVPVPGAGEERW